MNISIARRRVKGQGWQWLLVAVVVLCGPASARADVLTYYPSASATGANDLGDLVHQNYYAWTISGMATNVNVTGAYLTFKNLYNWDNTANILYLDLLDGAASGGTVLNALANGDANGAAAGGTYSSTTRYAVDASGVPVTVYDDAFDSANALYNSTKANLTEHSFLPSGRSPNSASDISWLQGVLGPAGIPIVDATFGGTTGWSFSANGSGWDYKYTFSAGQLGTLANYINGASSPGTIGLAFDPDCHFFNDGVSLTMTTQPLTISAVPEPASMLLLGTGLVACARRYRRRAAASKLQHQ